MHPIYTFIPELPNILSFKLRQQILSALEPISMFLSQHNFQSTLIFDDYYLNLFDSLFSPQELTLMRFILKEKLFGNRQTSTKIFAIYVCQHNDKNIAKICEDFADPQSKKIPSLKQIKEIRQQSTCCFQMNRWYNTYNYKGMFILTDKLIEESVLEQTGLSNVLSGQFQISSGYTSDQLNFIKIDKQSVQKQINNQENDQQVQQYKKSTSNPQNFKQNPQQPSEAQTTTLLQLLQNQNLQTLKVYRSKSSSETFKKIADTVQNYISYNQQVPQCKQNYLFFIDRAEDPLEIFKISEKFGPFISQFHDFQGEKMTKQQKEEETSAISQALSPSYFFDALKDFNQANNHLKVFTDFQNQTSQKQLILEDKNHGVSKQIELVDSKNSASIKLLLNSSLLQLNKFIPEYEFAVKIANSKVMNNILQLQNYILTGLGDIRILRQFNEWQIQGVSAMRYLYEEAKRNESEGSDIKFTYSLYLIIELSIAFCIALEGDEFQKYKRQLVECIQNGNLYVGNQECIDKMQYIIRDITNYVNKQSNGVTFYTKLLRKYVQIKGEENKIPVQQQKQSLFKSMFTSQQQETQSNQLTFLPSLVEMISYLVINQKQDVIDDFFIKSFKEKNDGFKALIEEAPQISYSQYYNYCKAVQQKNSIAGQAQLDQQIKQYEVQYDKTSKIFIYIQNGATQDEIATAQAMSNRQLAEVGFFNIGQVSSGHEVIIISDNLISAKDFILKMIQK